MKQIKNKTGKIIFLIAIFQILLLMNLIPAESYRIHQTDSSFSNSVVITNNDLGDKVKKILGIGVNLLIGFLSINEIGFVSAAEIKTSCCPDTCSDVVSTFTECKQPLIPTTCANTAECKLGCCFDPDEGLCSTNSPYGKCNADGGEWTTGSTCSISKCTKGCCVLGSNVKFTTEQNCVKLSQGYEKDFRQIPNELSCLALTASNFEGACVLSERNCKFESEKQCLYDGGTFHQDYLCSNSELDTKCEKQKTINCVSGKGEIYWFDSCGNRENIYSSDKTDSWNSGKVLAKADSCKGSEGGVIGSTSCGNCKQSLSTCSKTLVTKTHVSEGNFICKDLGCKNAIANVGTQNRINGERWCLYDGAIGNGKAVVGSEHWLAYCHNGEVKVERCGEYRTSVCQQYVINDPSLKFSTASCVVNDATDCLGITQEHYGEIKEDTSDSDRTDIINSMKEDCKKNNQCEIRTIDVSEYFKFSLCIPKYPKGNDLTRGAGEINYCEVANQKCSVIYEKTRVGDGRDAWDCKANCECETSKFAQQMNELCMAMGDCGNNVNYLGGGTNNSKITGENGKMIDSDGKPVVPDTDSYFAALTPAIFSWEKYQGNENPVLGDYVSQKDMSDEAAVAFGMDNFNPESAKDLTDVFGWISGTGGTLAAGLAFLAGTSTITVGAEIAATTVNLGVAALGTTMSVSAIFTAVGAVFAGLAAGAFLGRLMNRSPGMIAWLITIGGVAGVGAMFIMLSIAGGTCTTGGGCIAGAIIAFVAIVIFTLLALFGLGLRETRVIEFKCQPWNAPNGGTDCEKCNDNPLKPCTEYRCSSLGQMCTLKNENEQNPICFSLPRESNPPIISAGEVKTEGYEFQNEVSDSVKIIKSDGSENGCIHEFNQILFTLKTDEYAQCKYSFEIPNDPTYGGMEGEEIDENLFEKDHTFLFRMSSVDNENVYDLTQEANDQGQIVQYGKLDMYVKCQDAQEPPNYNIKDYVVKFCVNSGPDLTVVNFGDVVTNPENGAILKFEATEQDISFGINEPANCKFDTSEEISYDEMQYSMVCKTGISDAGINGWPCSAKVENLISGENKFYFKCKDMSENINNNDFVYTLKVSEKELKIDSVSFKYGIKKISFGEELKAGLEPISINVEVKTSGGGYNGKSYCLWGVSEKGYRWMMAPFDNAVILHDQTLVKMGGYHEMYIDCQDDAGNEASISGEFTINVDNLPPVVIRAYKSGESLKIVTDELARCYYNVNTCIFDIDGTSATSMNPSFSTTHTAPWNSGIIYYIRCKDIFGNTGECTKEISPG